MRIQGNLLIFYDIIHKLSQNPEGDFSEFVESSIFSQKIASIYCFFCPMAILLKQLNKIVEKFIYWRILLALFNYLY